MTCQVAKWPRKDHDYAQLLFNAGAALSRAGDDYGAKAQFLNAQAAYGAVQEPDAADLAAKYAQQADDRINGAGLN